jgi:hypothetical protein
MVDRLHGGIAIGRVESDGRWSAFLRARIPDSDTRPEWQGRDWAFCPLHDIEVGDDGGIDQQPFGASGFGFI